MKPMRIAPFNQAASQTLHSLDELGSLMKLCSINSGEQFWPAKYILASSVLFPALGRMKNAIRSNVSIMEKLFHFSWCCFIFGCLLHFFMSSGIDKHNTHNFVMIDSNPKDFSNFILDV